MRLLSQNLKLLGNSEFNHLTIILTLIRKNVNGNWNCACWSIEQMGFDGWLSVIFLCSGLLQEGWIILDIAWFWI